MQQEVTREVSNTPAKPYFRDSLQTIDEKGGRQWIYPRRPKGRYYNARGIVSILLLSFFFITPFIKVNGEPLILLNIFERKFILLGQVFWPQDFHLLVISIISFLVFVILFTVIYGRLFCGWACPQTIFMEFVFRQIEYLTEGSVSKQRKLDSREWDMEKVTRKGAKHILFILFSVAVIVTLFSYITGMESLLSKISEGPADNGVLYATLILFSGVFYGIYAFFREQVCILICPYGRLQGVLLDENSVVVAYDYKRGEPRQAKRSQSSGNGNQAGDCIDCSLCQQVCPTGIDIRNGTQLECINCTACIDACNGVMKRLSRPEGLIRYDSEKGISSGQRKIFNPRVIAYSSILVVLLGVTVTLFMMRGEVEATILRMPGSLYQEYGKDNLSNIYTIQLVNKSSADMPLELKLLSDEGEIIFIGPPIGAVKGEVTESTFMIVMKKQQLHASNTPIEIGIFTGDRQIGWYKTNFIAPLAMD